MTLRAGSSALVFALVAGAALILLGDAAIRGSWAAAARLAGPAILVVWVSWMLLMRPSIRVLRDRAVVVNIGRVTEIPWGRVIDIRRRLQLVLDLEGGRSLECWGSPFPRRRLVGRTAASDVDDPAITVLRGAWMSATADGPPAAGMPPVVRRVDTLALLIGAGSLVAASLSIAAAGAA